MSVGEAGVRGAWERYRAEIEALVDTSAVDMLLDGDRTDRLGDAAVTRSTALRDQIVGTLDDDSSDTREVAILQMCAAAVVDLSVGDYLAGLAHPPAQTGGVEGEATDEVPASHAQQAAARQQVLQELATAQPILTSEPGVWPPMMIGGADVTTGPREMLAVEATASLQSISDRASAAAFEVLVDGLLTLALPHVVSACTTPIHEIFGQAADAVPRLKRWAIRLVHEGVTKVMSVFGPTGDAVLDWVQDRLEAWSVNRLEPIVQGWVRNTLYEVPAIDAELQARIQQASRTDQMFGASIDLRLLRHRFGDQMQVLERLVRLVRRIASWIVALAHVWGIVVLALGYIVGTAYALLLGGDYVDWHGTENPGLLNRVAGVRAIVEKATPA